ncbi:MAG: hypothetical protein Q8904_05165 [Bacteroidota bacterium]|nr:hypothetical protein [Bacteroidota bacterium]
MKKIEILLLGLMIILPLARTNKIYNEYKTQFQEINQDWLSGLVSFM